MLNKLSDKKGATKSKTRKGRGIGSGKGKTAGRGVKGQKSRSGVSLNGYEGGQTPFYKRVPTKGFSNAVFKKVYNVFTLKMLQQLLDGKKIKGTALITNKVLKEAGLVKQLQDGFKIVAGGELKSALKLEVTKITVSAKEAVEKAGGSVKVIEVKEKVRKLPKKEAKVKISRIEKKKAAKK